MIIKTVAQAQNMLIEFSVQNYLSFGDRAKLSLVKSNGDELANNVIEPGVRGTPSLLRSAVIYGPNAAGKSNLILAIRTMSEIVRDSASKIQKDDKLPIMPFRLEKKTLEQPSEFEVQFISKGVRYQYGFAATETRITEEWLLAYPLGRPQRLIERLYDEKKDAYVWGNMDKLTGKKQVWKDSTRPNALFLSTAIQLNNQQLQPVFDWFSNTLRVAPFGVWKPEISAMLYEKEDMREKITSFLHRADLGIDGVDVEKKEFERSILPEDMPSSKKDELEREWSGRQVFRVKTLHKTNEGEEVTFDLFANESDGTQKIFAMAGPWLDTLEHGNVLAVDELHDNLHPLLVQLLVKMFNDPQTNPNNAQLIFTTHDTTILDQEVFRRDQIWFCEKDKTQSSVLYPLTDFKPRKGVENLERGYLSGRYGALPYFGSIKKAMGC